MKNQLKGTVSLLSATVIWGFAFIAQSVGMDLIGPFTFQMARCFLAVVFLIPCAFVLDLENAAAGNPGTNGKTRICGNPA